MSEEKKQLRIRPYKLKDMEKYGIQLAGPTLCVSESTGVRKS